MTNLIESSASGDRLAALRDLRDLLAEQIVVCNSARDIAALSGRFQSVVAEIDELSPNKSAGDPVDEISARRAARRAGAAKAPGRAKRTS